MKKKSPPECSEGLRKLLFLRHIWLRGRAADVACTWIMQPLFLGGKKITGFCALHQPPWFAIAA